MADSLGECGLHYRWFEALGGRRRPAPNSPNTGWRNTSFRGYADYLSTDQFQSAFEGLLEYAARYRTALMCSEVLWWRCHRALISDVLRVRGVQVIHILNETQTTEHPFTSPARVIAGRLSYEDVEQGRQLRLHD